MDDTDTFVVPQIPPWRLNKSDNYGKYPVSTEIFYTSILHAIQLLSGTLLTHSPSHQKLPEKLDGPVTKTWTDYTDETLVGRRIPSRKLTEPETHRACTVQKMVIANKSNGTFQTKKKPPSQTVRWLMSSSRNHLSTRGNRRCWLTKTTFEVGFHIYPTFCENLLDFQTMLSTLCHLHALSTPPRRLLTGIRLLYLMNRILMVRAKNRHFLKIR